MWVLLAFTLHWLIALMSFLVSRDVPQHRALGSFRLYPPLRSVDYKHGAMRKRRRFPRAATRAQEET